MKTIKEAKDISMFISGGKTKKQEDEDAF